MRRRNRVLAAFLAVFALVYAQLVFSGYSCSMFGMDGMDMSATLCQLHCDYGKQQLDAAKPAPQVPPAAPNGLTLTIAEPVPHSAGVLRVDLPAPGPAPPLIRFTVLRI